MTSTGRLFALPALALVLVSVVLGVQLAHGGGEFVPLKPADPCVERDVTSQSEGIDGLTERVVLLGIDGAACRLGVSREALTLELAQPGDRTDEQVDALREGLKGGVRRMADEGTLPPASDLVDEALENADLNRFLEALIKAIPDSVIDTAVDIEDVLIRTIDDLDLRHIMENLEDEDDLNRQLNAAVEQAVKDSLLDRLRDLL